MTHAHVCCTCGHTLLLNHACGKMAVALTSLAIQYLTCPASTVASERLFSMAGNILTESRNRLSPDKLDKLLFLHQNLEIVT